MALHVFPKDMETIRTWLLHINQDFGDLDEFCHKIFNSSKGTYRICSQHFTLDAYEIRGMVTFLKKDAVPTIFPQEQVHIPTRKRRKKDIPSSHAEAHMFTSRNLPFTSTAFSVPSGLDMPWNHDAHHCFGLKTNQSAAHSASSRILPGQQLEEDTPYKCKHYRSPGTGTVGTSIDYFPGQVHRSTQVNKPIGVQDKNLQTKLGPPCRSVGIQCNLNDLPSLPSRSTISSSGRSRLFNGNWIKLLQSHSHVYFHDD